MALAFAEVRMVGETPNAIADAADGLAFAQAFKNRLDHCLVVPVTQKKKVSQDELKPRQSADAFVIGDEIYLKSDRLPKWFPVEADRLALISFFDTHKIIRRTRQDTPTLEKLISGIVGKQRYHVTSPQALAQALASPELQPR